MISSADYQDPIVEIQDLRISFGEQHEAVRGISMDLYPGEILGVAGQSGSGKSLTALAALGLAPANARITGSIRFRGHEVLDIPEKQRSKYRGSGMTMIFQETVTALNPVVSVERQLLLAIMANSDLTKTQARERAVQGLRDVQLNDVQRVLQSYPYELSGGMCQRVMIAMALACGADVLFADEPTTALDVTVQREIMTILRRVTDERRLAVMLISHDIGVLDEVSDRLAVMYQGQIMETGKSSDVVTGPKHPYTAALVNSIPRIHGPKGQFVEMPTIDYAQYPPVEALAREGGGE